MIKKFILILFIILSGVFVANAQFKFINISGHVVNSNGGLPLSGHEVYLLADSVSNPGYTYFNIVVTDFNGYYNDSILVPQNSQILFEVFTFDCINNIHNVMLVSNNPPLIADFQICDSTNANCVANFMVIPDTINPFTFHFVDLSLGNPDLWFWDFGDGTSSNLQNPAHSYNIFGQFHVCLTITNTDSLNYCTSTYCDFVVVDSISNCNAYYIAHPAPADPFTYYFIDQSSPNCDHWLWEFGDGTTSMLQDPVHTYADTGWYHVCLTSSKGIPGTSYFCEDTYCDSVFVSMLPPQCHAEFSYLNDPLDPFTFSFLNASSGNFNELFWNFGDGDYSFDFSPTHTYLNPGTYDVCLTVLHINPATYDTVCKDTRCKQITIPPVNFYNLAGQVFANFFPVDMCNIQLCRIMNNGDVLSVDKTTIDTNGVYFFFHIPEGNYLIKAEPGINNPVFGQLLPTYFGNTLHWINAAVIHLDHDFFGADVHLLPYQFYGSGPGSISGNISFEGGKKQTKGIPAPDIEILLFDAQNMPVKLDYSDQNGHFKFNDLPFGSYKVYAEIAGKNTIPVDVTIDISNIMINDIYLVITNLTVIASLENNISENIESISDIYPNPANDMAHLDLVLFKTSNIEINIFNYVGQLIKTEQHRLQTGENRISLNLSELCNGIYSIQIIDNNNAIVSRKFIKIKQ